MAKKDKKREKTDLGQVFQALMIVGAIAAGIVALAQMVSCAPDPDPSYILPVVISISLCLVCLLNYWLIATFGKIYETLKSIDKKLDMPTKQTAANDSCDSEKE